MTSSQFDLRGRIDIALAALLFSTGGAAIKLSTFSGFEIAGLRSLIAALTFLVLYPQARTGWRRETWIVGSFYAATLTLFVLATKNTTAANAIFLQSSAPLYVLIAAPLFLREPLRRLDLFVMVALGCGLWTILVGGSAAQQTAPNPSLGNVLGALSGLTWAATLMGLRWLGKAGIKRGGSSAVILGNLLTFALCAPFFGDLLADDGGALATNIATIVYLGVFQVAAAYMLLNRGVRTVPAFSASLIILIEPAFNPLWTYLMHGEVISLMGVVGGLLIVVASIAKGAADAMQPGTP